jgi:hypothetical protein
VTPVVGSGSDRKDVVMGRWSRDEIESAFEHNKQVVIEFSGPHPVDRTIIRVVAISTIVHPRWRGTPSDQTT